MKNILTALLLFFFLSAQSQLNEHFDDIKKTFEKDKQENILKISNNIKEAQTLFTSADNAKMEKASAIFDDNYRELFFIYEHKLEKISKESQGEIGDYINYLLFEAKNSFRISISDRVSAKKENDEVMTSELLKKAHQNEIEAIDFQSRAFGLINGWITENLTIPVTNYSLEDNYDNSFTDNFDDRYFSVNNASIPGNYSFNRATQNYETSTDIVYSDKIENSDYNNDVSVGTEYRIQIGTSILPAVKSQTDRLNSTDLKVKTYKSKVYYKYTIGSFKSFQEAKNFKNAYGLSKTYISEYKNGKEVRFFMKDFY